MSKLSRRGMIKGLAAGAVVLGFNPFSRSWVTEARADTLFAALPPLDGRLATDLEARNAAANDWGHIVHRVPVAVLYPGSVDDIVKMVQFARTHGIRIASRGRGHTAFGQAQAEAGVVIDMSTLDTIHSISSDRTVVDAGVVWRDLLIETTAVGLTPPVLTDFIGLTIGGTLSVGGVSGASFRHGAQVDNVLEVQVVTGEGELVTCSPDEASDLFDATLPGLGLCAIIVRATIRLVPAKERARTFRFFYPDAPSMLADLRQLILANADVDDDGIRLDHIRGSAAPGPGGWGVLIEATSFYSAPDAPSASELLAGLNYVPGSLQIDDQPYFAFCDAVYQLVELFKQVGLYDLPHPWVDLFVPGSQISSFTTNTLASLNPAELVPGTLIAIYPFIRDRLTQPLLRVPDEEVFFLFDILRNAPPIPEAVAGILAFNRALYDQNMANGGTHYAISAVQLSAWDWKQHFQPKWGLLESVKVRYDPDNVLGAGVGVFP